MTFRQLLNFRILLNHKMKGVVIVNNLLTWEPLCQHTKVLGLFATLCYLKGALIQKATALFFP